MSLLQNATYSAPGAPLYGSGGGGGSLGPVASTTQLFVSSIGSATGGEPSFPNGLAFTGGSLITAGGGGPDIEFSGNNGTITGLSSINGSAYPPAGASANISTFTTSGGYFPGGASVALNAVPAAVTPNKWYLASLEITDMTFVAPPNATDAFNVTINDGATNANLGTFNMAQLSTNRGITGDLGFSMTGPYEALSTSATFTYSANAGAPSTFIVTSGRGWLVPLN